MAPDKILWYLVDYEWIQQKRKCTNPGQDKILETTSKTREIIPLQYLKANEAMFMLGMYIAPYGNNKDQVKRMHKKATSRETSIIVVDVQQNKSWKALN